MEDKQKHKHRLKVGDNLTNNQNIQCVVLELIKKTRPTPTRHGTAHRTYVKIKFLETGYITVCDANNFIHGKVKDYLRPSVQGVGILGYVEDLEKQYRLRDMKEYRLWEGIIRRCYGSEYEIENQSYKDATVCERWLRFDYFYEDVPSIEGYNLWKEYQIENPNKKNIFELDKDTKVEGNKVYSLETCIFIPKTYNSSYTSWASKETKRKILKRLEESKSENFRNERYINEKCFRVRTIYYNGQSNSKLIRRFKKHSPKNNMVNAFRWFKL
jgi:hypothetical protein